MSEDAQPKGEDDAKEAKFYPLKDIVHNYKDKMAFDHYSVIEELIDMIDIEILNNFFYLN